MAPLLLLSGDVIERLEAALDRARAGRPTVLVIEADAGLGKTALLSELVRRAADYRIARADGLESDRSPFTLLAQWDAEPPRGPGGAEPTPRLGAQALRGRLDSWATTGPVLLVIDDLHWADPESVEALLWLLRRTSGDRLLVAVGSRPLPPEVHTGWQRWVAGHDTVIAVALTGLTQSQVAELARRQWPRLSDEMARRLSAHIDGNPLYLMSMLAENEFAELSTTGLLPAPAAFARSIALRSARLSASALAMLRAVCVLGSSWSPLSLIAATSEVGDAAGPAQELIEAGLVELRRDDGPPQMRPMHALVRAAVHEQTSLPDRRRLNTRAAGLVASRSAALQHRMAAAEQYDEVLADEMEAYAAQLYGRSSYRQAGQFLRWASGLTPRPPDRERRWLESLFDTILGLDFVPVDGELDDVRAARNPVWRPLVLGLRAIWKRHFREGVDHLEPVSSAEIGPADTADPRPRYLVEVLLAWARLCLGHPTAVISRGLDRAAQLGVVDAGLGGSETITRSFVQVRVHGAGAVLEQLGMLPAAAAVPVAATAALGYRGSLRAALGLVREATDDLTETTQRVVDGVIVLGAGSFHAQLGSLQWMSGDWARARVSFHQAFDLSAPAVHQMTAALAPLVDIGLGRFVEADAGIARAWDLLIETPWTEACLQLTTTMLVRLHADGPETDRAAALARWTGTPFQVLDVDQVSTTVLLNYVPALVAAGRLAEAEAATVRLGQVEPAASWAAAVGHWYRGLILAARGNPTQALTELDRALAGELDLPLYRAHLLVDHAELAGRVGRAQPQTSLRRAEEIYDRLGAVPYLRRVRARLSTAATPVERLPGGVTLTEREQDVLTLLVAGMSYAQISRELFVTQSTVGYHLGNIYGKAGVNSRHQLTERARKSPQTFGISVRT